MSWITPRQLEFESPDPYWIPRVTQIVWTSRGLPFWIVTFAVSEAERYEIAWNATFVFN